MNVLPWPRDGLVGVAVVALVLLMSAADDSCKVSAYSFSCVYCSSFCLYSIPLGAFIVYRPQAQGQTYQSAYMGARQRTRARAQASMRAVCEQMRGGCGFEGLWESQISCSGANVNSTHHDVMYVFSRYTNWYHQLILRCEFVVHPCAGMVTRYACAGCHVDCVRVW